MPICNIISLQTETAADEAAGSENEAAETVEAGIAAEATAAIGTGTNAVASEETRRQLWEEVAALEGTELLDAPARDGDLILKIHAVNRGGLETETVIMEYDAENYQVSVDRGTPMLISADKIDALVRKVKSMSE